MTTTAIRDATQSYSGSASAKLSSDGTAVGFISSPAMALPGTSYTFKWVVKGSKAGNYASYIVNWYDRTGALVSSQYIAQHETTSTTWVEHSYPVTAPAGTASYTVQIQNDGAGGTCDLWVDSISVDRQKLAVDLANGSVGAPQLDIDVETGDFYLRQADGTHLGRFTADAVNHILQFFSSGSADLAIGSNSQGSIRFRQSAADAVFACTPSFPVVSKSANFTADNLGRFYEVTTGAGGVTASLPLPATCPGRIYSFTKVDTGAGALTVGGTVSGTLNPTLGSQWKSMTIYSNGSTWTKIASV